MTSNPFPNAPEVRAIVAATTALTGPGAIDRRVRTALAHVRRHLRIERLSLLVLEDRTTLRILAVDTRPRSPLRPVGSAFSVHEGMGISAQAVLRRREIVTEDYASSPWAHPDPVKAGVRSGAAFPLWSERRVIGVLAALSSLNGFPTPGRIAALRVVARNFGMLLGSTLSREREREQAHRLGVAIQRVEEQERATFHLARLAAIGELAATVSHELKNPLAGVLGMAELGLSRRDEAERDKLFDDIGSVGRRMLVSVDRLLDFAGQHEVDFERIHVEEAVAGALALASHFLSLHRIEIDQKQGDALPVVLGDDVQLEQVFLNLFINAAQAMHTAHGRGTLTLRAETRANAVLVAVQDDGPGIGPGILPHIFDPFFTTKGDEGGTGIGLRISRQIIVQHGGRVWAENNPGKGATFWVELPFSGT